MASKTSDRQQVKLSGTSVRNRKRGYYQTTVTTLANGSVLRETYRTDSKGNNDVKIQDVTVDKDGKVVSANTLSTASADEKKALANPDSQLSKAIEQQVKTVSDDLAKNNIDGVTKDTIDKAGGASGNDAPEPEQADSTEAPESDTETPSAGGSGLRYPKTLPADQDCIQFTALKYEAKQIEGLSFGARARVSVSGSGSPRSQGTVTLPIQSGIEDSNGAVWQGEEMNPLQIIKAGIALKTIGEGVEGFGDSLKGTGEAIRKASEDGDMQKALTGIFGAKAAGVSNLLSRTEGVVINPNLELLFSKPTLREFGLSFSLSARSKDEADTIIQIIRFFKKNMSPQRGGGSQLFLKAPNTFQVHYLHRGTDEHKYIGRMKECAIMTFDTDYTSNGQYTTLKDGYMTTYKITMRLKELEPVFYEDYDKDTPTDSVGY